MPVNPSIIPPHNHAAEKGVLGSMLFAPAECIPTIARLLTAADFHHPAHRTIYEVASGLWSETQAMDIILLTNALRSAKRLDAVGGAAAIAEIMSATPTAANAQFYAAQVREASVLRQIWQACSKAQAAALEPGADVAELSAALCTLMADVSTGRGTEARSMAEHVGDALDRYEAAYANRGVRPAGVMPLGLAHLDEQLAGGLHPSDLAVIAAETSGGKTAMAIQAACHAAVFCDAQVLIASYEMSAVQLVDRLVALASAVPSSRLRAGLLSERDMHGLRQGVGKLRQAGLHLRDQISRWTVDDIASEARAIKARHGLHMVVVDYLQLAEPRPTPRGKQQNRERDVADMSRGLKALAMELRVPVVALSQLTDGKLRESRAIGHDADVVLRLDDSPEGEESVRVCHIDKNRHGARDKTIYLAWDGPLMRFGDTHQPLKLVKPARKAA